MAELSAPWVYIEEVPSGLQIVQSVSTATMGIVGFTKRGPTDEAILVTSFEEFTRRFGEVVTESFTAISMAAYFANGGQRAYVVRVVPADATASDAKIQSQTTNQAIQEGDNVVVAFVSDGSTIVAPEVALLKDNGGVTPLVPGSVSMSWRGTGVAVAAGAAAATPATVRSRPGTADVPLVGATNVYEGRLRPTSLESVLDGHFVVVPGTVVITFDPDGLGDQTIAIVGTGDVATITTGQGSVATVDHRTGRLSVSFAGTEAITAPVGNLRAAFTPAGATNTIVDDGAGALTGVALAAPGTINYTTGAYNFTTTGPLKPHNKALIRATYKIEDFSLGTFKGEWSAERLRVDITGNPDFFTASTAIYTRFDVAVLLLSDSTGTFELLETFEELDFSDPTSKQYFATVINASSDWITVTVPGGEEPPLQLNGISRVFVIAGGDESSGGRTLTSASTNCNVALPNTTIAKRSVVITFTGTDAVVRTITDDGSGNLVGSIDGAYVTDVTVGGEVLEANTISYTTGRFNFRTSIAIDAGTLVSVSYVTVASETTHTELYGDPDKDYTAGTDGTFDSTNYGRDQFTNSALLQEDSLGLFAFDKVTDILQLVIPDFAGETTITGDILDYVDGRALLPSGGDRFAILTVPQGSSATEAIDWLKFDLNRTSKFAAVYAPWINVPDPLANGQNLLMPPMGHVAGIYARTDQQRSVAKAPAGTQDGALRFISSLESSFTIQQHGLLNKNKINALINVPNNGACVFGARTISNEAEWLYVPVRRLFMFIEQSIYFSTFWICFEPNGPNTWGRIKTQIDGFLTGLFNAGMLKGTSAAQAFKVIVDASNNPQETQDLGQIIIDVRVAANKPAEFVRFRVSQITGTA